MATAPKKSTAPRTRTTTLVDDYSGLTAVKSSAPIRNQGKNLLDSTPFRGFVQKSYDSGESMEFTVKSEKAAKQAANLLQKAANEKSYGLRKSVSGSGTTWKVVFKAQKRRAYSPRKRTSKTK